MTRLKAITLFLALGAGITTNLQYANAIQTGVTVQGITLEDERIERAKARARREHRARVQARREAEAEWEHPEEATAEIPVPLGDIPRIIYSIFGDYGAAAVSVASCESGLNPTAVNSSSGASGLFQLMPFHWQSSFDPFDPVANTRYAYGLSSGGTNWSAWAEVCRP